MGMDKGDKRHSVKQDYGDRPSSHVPLPYYPNLKIELRTLAAVLIFTYFEFHSDSETFHTDQICADLMVSRRTLGLNLPYLSTCYLSEEERRRSARAGREFIEENHTLASRIKPYSLVGSKGWSRPHSLTIRRNQPTIDAILRKCRINSLTPVAPLSEKIYPAKCDACNLVSTPLKRESLADIMLRASVLSGDRRTVRYDRLRAGIERGVVGAESIKVKRRKPLDVQSGE